MPPTMIDNTIGRIRKAAALMAFGAASLPGAGFAAAITRRCRATCRRGACS
jgi:hypothetical protein